MVRLKGGHPLVFARGGEEALALAAEDIPFRVLSGVTSAFGGLASAGIPATMRGINGAVILATGFAATSDDRPDWAALARTGQPIVIYMGLTHMAATVADLMKGGLHADTPAAFVENATLPEERTVVATLGTLAEAAHRENVVSPCPDRGRRTSCRCARSSDDDRTRNHRRRAALRLGQDHGHDRPAARAEAARHRGARREVRAGLHRSRLPRGGDRTRRRQSRQLGDAAGIAGGTRCGRSGRRRRGGDRKRDGPVRRHTGRAGPLGCGRRSGAALRPAGAAGARRVGPVADGGGGREGLCELRSGRQDRRRRAEPARQRAPPQAGRRKRSRRWACRSSAR